MDSIMAMMEEIGLPFAYDHFAEGESPEPPFICFLHPGSDNFSADGWAYFKVDKVYIELYTDEKDFALEKTVETTLNNYGIVFDKSEEYIDSERMHVTVYQSDIVLEV